MGSPPDRFDLARRDVHCWWVRLDGPPEAAAGHYETLTSDERTRSARLRFARDRRRFVAARGALRDLLGRYLGTDPGRIRFAYNAFGKPELSPEFGNRLRFNLSHSADLALIAITTDAGIGVDLEYLRAQPDYGDIARSFFSPTEVDRLNRLPRPFQPRAFFTCWTKKEAYVKARGGGLAIPLTSFSVFDLAGPWSLYPLQPAPGYVGALAIEGSGWRLSQRQWSEGITRRADIRS